MEILQGFTLMPTGTGNGVMAVCRRHEDQVSALVLNSISEPPSLRGLALMPAEHEDEEHRS